MGRIRGHYEWDNDDLAPGRKREGGLHQNLYDSKGNLRGSARFVPSKGDETDPRVVTETVYVPIEQRRRTQEGEALQQAISELVSHLLDRGIARAKPFVEQWWRETARPTIDLQRAKIPKRRSSRTRTTGAAEAIVVEPSQELQEAEEERRPNMSSAEAQARYLAALAAQAYSDEQMRLVTSANIVDGEGFAESMRSLADLPPDQVRNLIEAMATNPSMLGDETLAQLASVLGQRGRREDVRQHYTTHALDRSP